MNWFLFFVARDKRVQKKLQDELDEVIGDHGQVTSTDAKSLDYLTMVLKESMRLRPPVPIFMRKLIKDQKLGKYLIPGGTNICILVEQMHMNPDIYKEPEKFIPERFDKEANDKLPDYSWVPFSAGIRNCVGQKFATLELKVLLGTLLFHYDVDTLVTEEEIGIIYKVVNRPRNPVILRFQKRSR